MKTNTSNTMQALWLGLGSVSSFSLAILSAAILSRYFTKTDYGTYRQILYVYNTLLVIFSAGLPIVFSYYLPRHSLNEGKDIVWKLTKVLFLAGFIFSITLFFSSGIIARILKNSDLELGLKIFSPIPMLLLPTLGIEGIFSTYKRTIFVAIFNTVTRLVMLLFIVLPVIIYHTDFHYALYGWLASSIITLVLAIYFKGIPFKGIETQKSNVKLKDVFLYSLPLVSGSIWGMAIKAADQFYISRYYGAEVFAEFSNGFIELPFVTMITSATAAVLLPLFSKMIHEKLNVDSIVELWRNALLKSVIIIYPILIFFIINARNIVLILYSSKYESSVLYFQIAMLLNFFNIIIFAPLLFAMNKTRFYSYLHLYMAIAEWVVGFLVILLFKTPIAIAIMSVALAILKVLIAFYYVTTLINIKMYILFPVKQTLSYLLHSLLIMVIIKFAISFFAFNIISELVLSFIGYAILLLVTAPIFKLDYLIVLNPILSKLPFYAKKD